MTDFTNKYKIRYLHYMAHIDNAPSILKHGILSYNKMLQAKLSYKNISDAFVQNRRDAKVSGTNKTIHDYVPLYFATQTPMQYVITHSASSKKRVDCIKEEELIFIDIDPINIFKKDGVVFSDGNAASSSTTFYTSIEDLDKLDWDTIQGPGDYHGTQGMCYKDSWKRKRASEVLVPDCIPPELFARVVLHSNDAATELCNKIRNVNPRPKIIMKYSKQEIRTYYYNLAY